MTPTRLILAVLYGVLPLVLWPGSTSYEAAKFLVVFAAVGLLFLVAAAGAWFRRPLRMPRSSDILPFMLLLVVIPVSGIDGAEWSHVSRAWVLTALWVVVFAAASTLPNRSSGGRGIMWAIVSGATLAALYGVLQIVGLVAGPEPSLGVLPGISTFGNENQTAGYAAAAWWVALALALLERGGWRIAAAGCAAVLLLCVLAADATGPKIAVAAAAAVALPAFLLISGGRRRPAGIWLGVSLAGGGLATAWVFALILSPTPPPLPAAVDDWLGGNSGDIRRTNWLVATHILAQEGAGFAGAGNYQVRWPAARAELGRAGVHPGLAEHVPVATRAHNEYLQGLAEFGPLGAVWFLGLLMSLAVAWRRRLARIATHRRGAPLLVLLGSVITFAVLALVSFPFHLPAHAFLLAGVLGLISSGALESAPAPSRQVLLPRLAVVPLALCSLGLIVLGCRDFVGDAHAARGERLYAAGRFDSALTALDRAESWVVWPGTLHLYRGLTLSALGKSEEAAEAYATSLETSPRYEGYLGLAEAEIERGAFQRADELLAVVEGCGPTEGFRRQARYLRGLGHLRRGDPATARTVLESLLTDDPRHARTLLALGYLNVLDGNRADARRLYQSALHVIEDDLLNDSPRGEGVRLRHLRAVALRAVESLN